MPCEDHETIYAYHSDTSAGFGLQQLFDNLHDHWFNISYWIHENAYRLQSMISDSSPKGIPGWMLDGLFRCWSSVF